MGRYAGISLMWSQRRELQHFMVETKDKREYRAAMGVLSRADGKPAIEVAGHFGVTIKQVFTWTRKFRERFACKKADWSTVDKGRSCKTKD